MASWADGAVDELIAASGGDRTTIVAFEAAHQSESPTNGETCQGRVKGNTESSTCYWGGWQSGQNATTYIIITAESGSETNGTDGSGDDAVIDTQQATSETTNALYIDFTRVEFNGQRLYINALDAGGRVRVARCYFRNNTSAGVQCTTVNADVTIKVGTCLFKAVGNSGYEAAIFLNDANITTALEAFNNTAYGCRYGFFEFNGVSKLRNCVAADSTQSDFSGINDADYNASEDTTSSGSNSIDNITPADEWTSPGTGSSADFTIKDTGADIYHSGEARAESWFTSLCPTDLAGTSWNSPPSMGCFEFAGAGPTIKLRTLGLLGVGR